MPVNFGQLSFMGQLAQLAAQNPEQFAELAASKGISPASMGGDPAAAQSAISPLGDLIGGQPGGGAIPAAAPGMLNPTIQDQMQQPMGTPPVVIPPGAGMPQAPTPTPATAADPLSGLLQGLGQVKAPATPTLQQAPLAPATPVPQGRGMPDAQLTQVLAGLLSPPQAQTAPTLGSIIGGTYRRFA